MYWLPRSVGSSKEEEFKYTEIFLHDPVICFHYGFDIGGGMFQGNN